MTPLEFGQMVTRALDHLPYELVETTYDRHVRYDLGAVVVNIRYSVHYGTNKTKWAINRVSVEIGDEVATVFYGRLNPSYSSSWHWSDDYAALSDAAKVQIKMMFADYADA